MHGGPIDPQALRLNRRSVVAARAAHGPVVPEGPDQVVLGSQVARFFHVTTGDTITIREERFRVVGVLDPTLTGPDSFVFMPFATAQRLLLESDRVLHGLATGPGADLLPLATAAAVFWADGEDPEVVARRIRQRLENVAVLSPAEAATQIDRALAVINGLLLGSGFVALVIAALAVANTMLTAVTEHRRELGLLRIVGATRRQVIGRLLLEAAVLGVAGGAGGLLAGLSRSTP